MHCNLTKKKKLSLRYLREIWLVNKYMKINEKIIGMRLILLSVIFTSK